MTSMLFKPDYVRIYLNLLNEMRVARPLNEESEAKYVERLADLWDQMSVWEQDAVELILLRESEEAETIDSQ